MKEKEKGFKFQSSGRELHTHGTDCLSIGYDGSIRVGYDSYADIVENGEIFEDTIFTVEEKKELANYMINQWFEWGNQK